MIVKVFLCTQVQKMISLNHFHDHQYFEAVFEHTVCMRIFKNSFKINCLCESCQRLTDLVECTSEYKIPYFYHYVYTV